MARTGRHAYHKGRNKVSCKREKKAVRRAKNKKK